VSVQPRLFHVDVDEARLGPVEREILARVDRYGWVGEREAGRIVYLGRGHNPDRTPKDWLARAGFQALAGLRADGLLERGRHGRWARPTAVAGRRSA
jgi:hypothetical protein